MNRSHIGPLLIFIFAIVYHSPAQQIIWKAEKGSAFIHSDAPLELISAETHSARGIIDPANKSFAVVIPINSFEGFNSAIQRTHFLENYMEHKKFPQATFTGKWIEDIPYETPGTYQVRAKGMLDIHGMSRERIIRCTLIVGKDSARVQSSFWVPVSDHGITIPRIVRQKIAEQISVTIDIAFIQGIKS